MNKFGKRRHARQNEVKRPSRNLRQAFDGVGNVLDLLVGSASHNVLHFIDMEEQTSLLAELVFEKVPGFIFLQIFEDGIAQPASAG